MSWLKIDDAIWSHPKFVGLSDSAHTLWFRGAAWCSQYLTDGFLPDSARNLFGQLSDSTAQELVDARLWVRVEGGWKYHDWGDWNPTAKAVKERREADRLRKAKKSEPKKNSAPEFRTESARNPDGIVSESSRPVPVPVLNTSNDVLPPIVPHPGDGAGTELDTPRAPKPPAYSAAFMEFWEAFPSERKRDKRGCAKKFTKAIKAGIPARHLIDAAKSYRDDPNREPQFTVNPLTWLREQRWESGPLPSRTATVYSRSQQAAAADFARLTNQNTPPEIERNPQ